MSKDKVGDMMAESWDCSDGKKGSGAKKYGCPPELRKKQLKRSLIQTAEGASPAKTLAQ